MYNSGVFASSPGSLPTLIAALVVLVLIVPWKAAAQTQSLAGNHPTVSLANLSARATAARTLNLYISFAPRNPVALAKLLVDLQNPSSPRYPHWLSPAHFDPQFGRRADEVPAIHEWLSGQGFH